MRWRCGPGRDHLRRLRVVAMATAVPRAEAVEWVRLGGHTVIATEARSWLRPVSAGDVGAPFSAPMRGQGTAASAGNLLDGVLAAAGRDVPRAPVPRLTAL